MPRYLKILLTGAVVFNMGWGFFAHQKINRLAVFILPPGMMGFYKKNIQYLSEASVNPDRRRYAVPEEAPRHYIDLDEYGDSAVYRLPRYWNEAVKQFGEDTLAAHGTLPWQITRSFFQLREAFLLNDPDRILKVSADLGHYIGDAHVPLHTTRNYDGQLTGQQGIHAFWESRLPELFFGEYDFFVGKAEYVSDVQGAAWQAIARTHLALDSVLRLEKQLQEKSGGQKYSFESRGKQTIKVVSSPYARQYHNLLTGMIERQLRGSIRMTGDLWFTAWVDAGQPDLEKLIGYQPAEEELEKRKEELKLWRERTLKVRNHEWDENDNE